MKKVVLVTGGSRGIGLALIRAFQKNGYSVATCARSDLSDNPADLKLKCDVADPAQVSKTVKAVMEKFGRLDVLVNNAGLTGTNVVDARVSPSQSDDPFHEIMAVNVNGTYFFCKEAVPHLPDQSGAIINISSVLGLKGVPEASAYCAAKHAVIGFTKSLAHDLSKRRITVNAICPGWTRTDMAFGRMDELGWSEADLSATVPLGRFVEPEEIAQAAVFLASPNARGMTGASMTIDGGSLA